MINIQVYRWILLWSKNLGKYKVSLITRAGDLVYTFRFLKLLITSFEETDAYKLGVIDASGKRDKKVYLDTPEKKSAYTPFHRLVFNIKKILAKAPGGSSKFASYASALFLIKEHFDLSDQNLEKILKESGLTTIDLIENNHAWFLLPDNQLSPGIYRVKNEKVLSESLDEVVNPKDKIRISENAFPIDNIFGLNIYKGEHLNTGKTVHVALGEIYK